MSIRQARWWNKGGEAVDINDLKYQRCADNRWTICSQRWSFVPLHKCLSLFFTFKVLFHDSVREQRVTSSPNHSATNYGWLVEAFAFNHRNNISANICFFLSQNLVIYQVVIFLIGGKIQKQVEHFKTATLPLIKTISGSKICKHWQTGSFKSMGGKGGRHVFFKKTNRNQPGGISSFLKHFSPAYL